MDRSIQEALSKRKSPVEKICESDAEEEGAGFGGPAGSPKPGGPCAVPVRHGARAGRGEPLTWRAAGHPAVPLPRLSVSHFPDAATRRTEATEANEPRLSGDPRSPAPVSPRHAVAEAKREARRTAPCSAGITRAFS
jgi:hypothetical protein